MGPDRSVHQSMITSFRRYSLDSQVPKRLHRKATPGFRISKCSIEPLIGYQVPLKLAHLYTILLKPLLTGIRLLGAEHDRAVWFGRYPS
jgi:hypothetical protein